MYREYSRGLGTQPWGVSCVRLNEVWLLTWATCGLPVRKFLDCPKNLPHISQVGQVTFCFFSMPPLGPLHCFPLYVWGSLIVGTASSDQAWVIGSSTCIQCAVNGFVHPQLEKILLLTLEMISSTRLTICLMIINAVMLSVMSPNMSQPVAHS